MPLNEFKRRFLRLDSPVTLLHILPNRCLKYQSTCSLSILLLHRSGAQRFLIPSSMILFNCERVMLYARSAVCMRATSCALPPGTEVRNSPLRLCGQGPLERDDVQNKGRTARQLRVDGNLATPLARPDQLQGRSSRDDAQPRSERTSSIKALEGGGQFGEDFLQHVLCVGRRVGKAVRDGEHRIRVLFIQRLKSLAVSGGSPTGESRFLTCLNHSINSLAEPSSTSTASDDSCGELRRAPALLASGHFTGPTILDATKRRNLTCAVRTALISAPGGGSRSSRNMRYGNRLGDVPCRMAESEAAGRRVPDRQQGVGGD